jgi:hypothetical protein
VHVHIITVDFQFCCSYNDVLPGCAVEHELRVSSGEVGYILGGGERKWGEVGFFFICRVVVGGGGIVSGLLLCGSNENDLVNCKVCELVKWL